jgi:HicB family
MTTQNAKAQKKIAVKKFPLRLMPSVRKVAEAVSQKEGVSLNQFINLAVAEKVAHLQHDEWLARRPKASPASIAKAMEILNRPTAQAPEADDSLPTDYVLAHSAQRR